ncbi:hypothetical protein BZA05DRAFT_31978 [Tricharina praecox]|uniref:uncharacterized protein n=1 Tax=Tricharina praecox TaxID=43433 RepID=UPI00221E9F8F|nr:uncharacterized protein BZA05DRAFT_31978 [Tricharina praecox]KAI5853517.1 hypothetical protein BZA05DRAFT_31978 [Tricharina praecox]
MLGTPYLACSRSYFIIIIGCSLSPSVPLAGWVKCGLALRLIGRVPRIVRLVPRIVRLVPRIVRLVPRIVRLVPRIVCIIYSIFQAIGVRVFTFPGKSFLDPGRIPHSTTKIHSVRSNGTGMRS